jgi:hypothetical protein
MLDVAAERKKPLKAGRYIRFNIKRRHPRIKGRNHCDRNVELRKHVHGHSQKRHNAKDDCQNCPDDDDVGIA